jgi:hypothetical protein
MEKIIKKWYKQYRKEPYWIDNWIEPSKRLQIYDKNGNVVARDVKLPKSRLPKRNWKLADYCKYCTDFLIERTGDNAEDNCIQCGIRDQLQKERHLEAPNTENRVFSAHKN